MQDQPFDVTREGDPGSRYYDGPVSDHFDGAQFFDPVGAPRAAEASLAAVLAARFAQPARTAFMAKIAQPLHTLFLIRANSTIFDEELSKLRPRRLYVVMNFSKCSMTR
jgi:hypothetical protein